MCRESRACSQVHSKNKAYDVVFVLFRLGYGVFAQLFSTHTEFKVALLCAGAVVVMATQVYQPPFQVGTVPAKCNERT